jgi:hypothetical protein
VKSPFTGKLELVPLFDGRKPVQRNGHSYYAVRNELSFKLASGETITVYAGQCTDLASIPPVVWWCLPPDGPWALAAVFHDAGYRSCGSFAYNGQRGRTRSAVYSRAEVDDILRQAMVALGVPAWKRFVIYRAVRLFGQVGWGT